jgi:hypothetical protein
LRVERRCDPNRFNPAAADRELVHVRVLDASREILNAAADWRSKVRVKEEEGKVALERRAAF